MTSVANVTRGTILAESAEMASTAWQQFTGLMGRETLAMDAGVIFPHTRGVHTHFMRFAIDVIFYDGRGVVLGIEHSLRPWRFSTYHFRAKGAVELPAGTARTSATVRGDVLKIS